MFEGGTALSKLYFPEIWQFSEDLDFTATTRVTGLRKTLESALHQVEAGSGIDFDVTNVHEAGDPIEYIQVDVQYDAVLGQRNTTDLDITVGEPLVFPSTIHLHSFEDVPEFELAAYSVEEIVVEKLRSLFQRARARDYYDLYRLLHQESFDDRKILEALKQKSRAQNVDLDLETGIPEEHVDGVRRYWDQALDRLVRDRIEFDPVIHQIREYLDRLATIENRE